MGVTGTVTEDMKEDEAPMKGERIGQDERSSGERQRERFERESERGNYLSESGGAKSGHVYSEEIEMR